jgi:hypothetical protein
MAAAVIYADSRRQNMAPVESVTIMTLQMQIQRGSCFLRQFSTGKDLGIVLVGNPLPFMRWPSVAGFPVCEAEEVWLSPFGIAGASGFRDFDAAKAGNTRARGGRKRFEPSDEARYVVAFLAGAKMTHQEIGYVIQWPDTGKPIGEKVLERAFPEELAGGKARLKKELLSEWLVDTLLVC